MIKSYPYASKNISSIVLLFQVIRVGYKALLLKIIASLSGIEKVNVNFLMEQGQIFFVLYKKVLKKKQPFTFLEDLFQF